MQFERILFHTKFRELACNALESVLELKKACLKAASHRSFGKTAPEIVRLSREHTASMIVMGLTDKDWFQEYWLGGVSYRVADSSELPVLLVP